MLTNWFRPVRHTPAPGTFRPALEALESRETPSASGLTQQLENEVAHLLRELGQPGPSSGLPAELRVIEQTLVQLSGTPGGRGDPSSLINRFGQEFKADNPQLFAGGRLQLSALFAPNGHLNLHHVVVPGVGSLNLDSIVSSFEHDKSLDAVFKNFLKEFESQDPQLFGQLLSQFAGSFGLDASSSHSH